MNNTEKLTFIEGNFTNAEAKEIIMSIFDAKINFLKLKNLSSHVGNGKEDESALNKISELKKGIETVAKMSLEAKDQKKKLTITSNINISFSDD